MALTALDVTSEVCDRIIRHAYSEDILALAGDFIREFDEHPSSDDDIHDDDWYITHWVLLDIYESGFITRNDYERYEHEVDEFRFADFMRCLNGFECSCP